MGCYWKIIFNTGISQTIKGIAINKRFSTARIIINYIEKSLDCMCAQCNEKSNNQKNTFHVI